MRAHPVYKNYLCDENGEVHSLYTKKKLKPNPYRHGYITVGLYLDGQKKSKLKHVIVWEAFHSILVPAGYEIDHIDGNKLNNCIKNLACLTRAEHNSKTRRTNPKISESLKKHRCRKVMRVSTTGESVEFGSLKTAAVSVMGCPSYISRAIMSKDPYRGYFWQDLDDVDFDGEYWTYVKDENRGGIVALRVSNFGRLQYLRYQKTFGSRAPGGYRFRYLGRHYFVHELICQVFCGPKPSLAHTVDHLSRDPYDNRPDNLIWATRKQQARNRRTVKPVEGYVLGTGLSLGIWPTITDAAAATGAPASGISVALNKRRISSGKTSDIKKIAWRYDEVLFI